MNDRAGALKSLCGETNNNGPLESAIAIPLFGSARKAAQAGIELGIDFAAKPLEVTAHDKTNDKLAGQTTGGAESWHAVQPPFSELVRQSASGFPTAPGAITTGYEER
jgi:hypothetical protein